MKTVDLSRLPQVASSAWTQCSSQGLSACGPQEPLSSQAQACVESGRDGWLGGPGASGGHVESVSLCSDLVWELEGCGLFEAATGAIFRP